MRSVPADLLYGPVDALELGGRRNGPRPALAAGVAHGHEQQGRSLLRQGQLAVDVQAGVQDTDLTGQERGAGYGQGLEEAVVAPPRSEERRVGKEC